MEEVAFPEETNEPANELRRMLFNAGPAVSTYANSRDATNQLPPKIAITTGSFHACIALIDHDADITQLTSRGLKLSKICSKEKVTAKDIKLYFAISVYEMILTTYVKHTGHKKLACPE